MYLYSIGSFSDSKTVVLVLGKVLEVAVLATAVAVAAVVLAVVVAFARVSLRMISCHRSLENRSFLPFSEKA